ncbi:phosphatidylserine decarboxylase [Methyloceanibacter sp. wino2]|uniref:phosphatidylserine decarboxylase n=1 Tax=Methyloceanibacter sp. wino2 TaxID=2170729 RepID=UPI000D3E4F3E|nr:phosphatidylserine decarboxylase [Methyloceanibacter sp. wino2]
MDDRHNLLDTIANAFVPIHPDGYKFVAIGAIATLVFFLFAPTLGWLCALLTVFCAYFFRDPERVTPDRPGLVVSAADGKVSAVVEDVMAPRELALGTAELTRVSVFLSVFDVHIIRAPVGGKIIHSTYVHGAFFNAELDKASEENERQAFVIETKSGTKIGVVLIAGLVARRIVPFVGDGDSLEAGQRIGLIRFGSRVDLYLPQDSDVLGEVGQTAISAETVLAVLPGEAKGRA